MFRSAIRRRLRWESPLDSRSAATETSCAVRRGRNQVPAPLAGRRCAAFSEGAVMRMDRLLTIIAAAVIAAAAPAAAQPHLDRYSIASTVSSEAKATLQMIYGAFSKRATEQRPASVEEWEKRAAAAEVTII